MFRVLRSLEVICMFSTILAVSGMAGAGDWPELPAENAATRVPAQEWPHRPGPREVKVYLHYPGGKLEGVNSRTGLMLSLHNWGGTGSIGTADPEQLAERYNVVAICVDYLQSGKWVDTGPPYDFGYLQALDALRALYAVYSGLERLEKPFARGRIFSTGGSGGGNVTLMVNKLAPRTFACILDMCGMAKLNDDFAYGLPGGTHINAGYSRDPSSANYLSPDDQEIRFVGHRRHVEVMKRLGNVCKILVIHGVTDASCPVGDAQEMAANFQRAGLDVEPHFVTDVDLDGNALKTTGHALGDRTQIVFRFGDPYLLPDGPQALQRKGPSDFERRDEVRYPTANGQFVICYTAGYPVARFEAR
ncbi:MAG: DUF2920 family protein [Rhodopirellula sp.]|nr:DUF2920 family protein [Rhodopirellula sp.]